MEAPPRPTEPDITDAATPALEGAAAARSSTARPEADGCDVAQSSNAVYAARDLEVTLGGKRVVGPLDLDIRAGSFLGILGPNGSGKTTLLKAFTGGVRPSAGTIHLEGRPLSDFRPTEMARRVGVVPQHFNLDFNFTVSEMVAMGRYAYGESAADSEAVAAALKVTGLTELSGRMVTQLSGGERQRALIAQTLAQQSPTLLLDEPLNNLDLNHQLEIMQLLSSLHSQGRTIAIVLHDLNMAAQYCDDLLLLDQGRQAARGPAEAVLDPAIIMEVFRVRTTVHRHGRRPYITPLWTHTREDAADTGRPRVHVIAGAAPPPICWKNWCSTGSRPQWEWSACSIPTSPPLRSTSWEWYRRLRSSPSCPRSWPRTPPWSMKPK